MPPLLRVPSGLIRAVRGKKEMERTDLKKPAIEAVDVKKSFGEIRAVDGLTLRLAEGEIYGLVGPDGAGKTTAMRLLCGAMKPDAGKITVAGWEVPRHSEAARAHIGYLPQRFSLYEELSVLENLRFFAEVRGLSGREWLPRSLEILEFVGLAAYAGRRAGQLSGGMKQKLGLAAALVHRPQILLLDEPTTGVDPVTRQSFWQLIIGLVSEERLSVLVSTPYMDEAGRCNRVGFLQAGRLVVEGPPGRLRAMLAGRILEVVGRPLVALRETARADPDVEDAQMFGDRLHLRVRAGALTAVGDRIRAAAADRRIAVERVRAIDAGLEDVFISLLEAKP
jgi:ABC-2 type transport system ATP-binding protein